MNDEIKIKVMTDDTHEKKQEESIIRDLVYVSCEEVYKIW